MSTASEEQPAGRRPAPPVPTVRGRVQVAPVPAPTVRAKASVPEAIEPAHRESEPYGAPRPRSSVREGRKAARERAAAREAAAREAAEHEAAAREAEAREAEARKAEAREGAVRKAPATSRPDAAVGKAPVGKAPVGKAAVGKAVVGGAAVGRTPLVAGRAPVRNAMPAAPAGVRTDEAASRVRTDEAASRARADEAASRARADEAASRARAGTPPSAGAAPADTPRRGDAAWADAAPIRRPAPAQPAPERPVVTVPAAGPNRPFVRKKGLLAAALLVVAVAATTIYLVADRRAGRGGDVGRWGTEVAQFAAPSDVFEPSGTTAPAFQGLPTRLKIKAIGVDTPLEALRLGDDGELTPPRSVDRAGWYADGTRPGDPGPAVIAGHGTSRRGPAVFRRLRELDAGDRIDVVRGGRTIRFTVTSTARLPRSARDKVFEPTPARQLRIIAYGADLVVYAAVAA